DTYDHRILNSALPVRSAVLKQDTGGLVVRWVTTSESPLLYVFAIVFASTERRTLEGAHRRWVQAECMYIFGSHGEHIEVQGWMQSFAFVIGY
ncbi:uncharacterized protein K460DRAFT_280964, partial [Cucurbitaria berberidis CBS 394.84]